MGKVLESLRSRAGLGVSFRQVFVGGAVLCVWLFGFLVGRHGGMFGAGARACS